MRIRFRRLLRPSRCFSLLAATALGNVTACIPYTVGSTAQTAAVGKTTVAASSYVVPNAIKPRGDSIAGIPLLGTDLEWRYGLDEQSDVGVRVMPGDGGLIGNYKHRFLDAGPGQPALAYMVGGGVVNWGDHAHLEATLIASGDESSGMTPYGGLRAMQTVPLNSDAVKDSPTVGGFVGLKIGDANYSIRPELGVYYDRPALGLRTNNIIYVPAVTISRAPRQGAAEQAAREAEAGARVIQAATTARHNRRRCSLLCRLLGTHP